MSKCPHCGGYATGKLQPSENSDKFMLTEVNSKTGEINIASGILVDAYGCGECKAVHLKNDSLGVK